MKRDEKEFLQCLRGLPPEAQETLFAFAEFLAARAAQMPREFSEPESIPRPEEESVVQAIKRLRRTYPMLDHSKMLHELTDYMTQHLISGKPAVEVIDELETVFQRHYAQSLQNK